MPGHWSLGSANNTYIHIAHKKILNQMYNHIPFKLRPIGCIANNSEYNIHIYGARLTTLC